MDCFAFLSYVFFVAAVLKAAATSAEKTQAPSTPSSEQKASEGTPGYKLFFLFSVLISCFCVQLNVNQFTLYVVVEVKDCSFVLTLFFCWELLQEHNKKIINPPAFSDL